MDRGEFDPTGFDIDDYGTWPQAPPAPLLDDDDEPLLTDTDEPLTTDEPWYRDGDFWSVVAAGVFVGLVLKPGDRLVASTSGLVPFGEVIWSVVPAPPPPLPPPVLVLPVYVAPEVELPEWGFTIGAGASTGSPSEDQELTEAYGRLLVWSERRPSIAQFTIDGRSAEIDDLVPLASDLVVRRDGVKMFTGRILTEYDPIERSRHTLTMSATDYAGMLARRTVGAVPPVFDTPTDQAEIVAQLVEFTQGLPGGDWGVTRGLIPAGQPRVRSDWPPGKDLWSIIDEMSEVENGFNWEISADLELNIWSPRRVRDQGVKLGRPGSIATVRHNFSHPRFANVFGAIGDETTTPVFVATAGIASDPRGRFELVEVSPTVSRQQNLDDRAPRGLADHSRHTAEFVAHFVPGGWEGREQFDVGDLAVADVNSGRLGSYLVRCVEMQVVVGDHGTEDVSAWLVREPD